MFVAGLLPLAASAARFPAWFDTTIAGYAFKYDEKHSSIGVHDPKSGFFLLRTIECDGADVTLLLTRDHHEVGNYGMDLTEKSLPNLTTGKGLSIGDSEARMKGRLGAPSSFKRDGDRKQFRVFTYHCRAKDSADILSDFDQAYTFKNGRLIEISFSKSLNQD